MNQSSTHRKWLRWLASALAAALVAAVAVVAWLPKPVDVEVAPVTRGPLVVTVDEDGYTRVIDRYLISTPIVGNLGRIELDAGDAIEAGQVLARLVPLPPPLLDARSRAEAEARVNAALAAKSQAQSAVARARASLDFAHSEASRARAVVEQGGLALSDAERAISEERRGVEELRSANFGVRVSEHELSLARAAMMSLSGKTGADQQMDIVSPIEGRVLKVYQQSEGVVQAGTPIIEVGDPSALEIVVDVLSQDATRIRAGAHTQIIRWGGKRPLDAHVRVVEPSAFTKLSALGVEEQRVNVVIDLDEPHEVWEALGDGYRVEAEIAVSEKDQVLRVPASAVFRHGAEWATFVIEDDRAAVCPIELGETNGLETEVVSGLEEGESVIAYPSDSVRDGVSVRSR